MKLDTEPRLNGVSPTVMDWARKVALVVNKNDDTTTSASTAQAAQIAAQALLITQAAPPGAVFFVAFNTAPTGWLKANGAAVSRTTYALLFAAIGTTWGVGDGSTTFNVPDLRGEFLRGWDDSRGVDASRVFASFQADDFRSHNHAIASNTTFATTGAAEFNLGSFGNRFSANTGGVETRPRNRALLACIKY